MNKIKLLVALIMFFVFSNETFSQGPVQKKQGFIAQRKLVETNDVPQVVKDAQQRMFPGTTVEKWFIAEKGMKDKEGKGNVEGKGKPTIFVAKFKNKEGFDTHCRITETGEVRGYMTRLEGEKGLPSPVKDAVLKRFQGYKIMNSQKIYHAKNNKSAYRVVLTQNSTRIITFVDENGNEIKEENLAPELKENIIEAPEK